MSRATFLGSVLGSVLLLWGCGSAGLATGRSAETLVTVGGGQRAVITVTDLDTIRDVAVSAERVYVATDRGLLSFAATGEGDPRRFTTADGLPSDDVRGVVVGADNAAFVVTSDGTAAVLGDGVTPVGPAPPVGEVTAVVRTDNGDVWAGGVDGVAKLTDGVWVRFGEPASVTTMATTADSEVWVGTTRGMWLIQGEIVREHGFGQGMPEGYVRAVVPMGDGEALALLSGPSTSQIGHWDGERWWGYTLAGFEPPVVSMVRYGTDVVLLVPGHAFAIAPDPERELVALVPLSKSELRTVRSYRARVTPLDELRPSEIEENDPSRDVSRAASALAPTPVSTETIEAPPFGARPVEIPVPDDVYLTRNVGGALFLADRHRGVTRIAGPGGPPTVFRSRDLVRDRDLQVAVDAGGHTWFLGKDAVVARWTGDHFERERPPEGTSVQSIANGPDGAYVLTRVGTEGATLRLYRVSGDGWSPLFDRELSVEGFVGAPFFALLDDMTVWAGIRIQREEGEGTRMRGVAVFGAGEAPIVYHRRGATEETDGPGALSMPDEVESIDLGMNGYAWFPGLTGAIRVGNHQAIVFGEARGVRGEVVSDLVVGDNERVWIAAAEGVGYYENQSFEFRLPGIVQQSRPTALALDSGANLWAAGHNGVVYYDGQNWVTLTEENGLPTNALEDVEVDGRDRVWFLAEDRVMIFTRTTQ